jgi:aminomethyltransferase
MKFTVILMMPQTFGMPVWDAGQEFNISPMGFEALDMLRIEAGLILGGHEFSDETDPFEAGISFTVPLKSKEQNFIGKEALD